MINKIRWKYKDDDGIIEDEIFSIKNDFFACQRCLLKVYKGEYLIRFRTKSSENLLCLNCALKSYNYIIHDTNAISPVIIFEEDIEQFKEDYKKYLVVNAI